MDSVIVKRQYKKKIVNLDLLYEDLNIRLLEQIKELSNKITEKKWSETKQHIKQIDKLTNKLIKTDLKIQSNPLSQTNTKETTEVDQKKRKRRTKKTQIDCDDGNHATTTDEPTDSGNGRGGKDRKQSVTEANIDPLPLTTETDVDLETKKCNAKRVNGMRCSRKAKPDSCFCGTHSKHTPYGFFSEEEIIELEKLKDETTRIHEVFMMKIDGIIYYGDDYGNLYDPHAILHKSINPPVIGKYRMDETTGQPYFLK